MDDQAHELDSCITLLKEILQLSRQCPTLSRPILQEFQPKVHTLVAQLRRIEKQGDSGEDAGATLTKDVDVLLANMKRTEPF